MKKDLINCDNCEKELPVDETYEVCFTVGTKIIGRIKACEKCKKQLEDDYRRLINNDNKPL